MTAGTIRVRVNPADGGEFAVYVDPDDSEQPWVRSGGAVVGWECHITVADWPEFELAIPCLADPVSPESRGSP